MTQPVVSLGVNRIGTSLRSASKEVFRARNEYFPSPLSRPLAAAVMGAAADGAGECDRVVLLQLAQHRRFLLLHLLQARQQHILMVVRQLLDGAVAADEAGLDAERDQVLMVVMVDRR